jgi:hypothetical protein
MPAPHSRLPPLPSLAPLPGRTSALSSAGDDPHPSSLYSACVPVLHACSCCLPSCLPACLLFAAACCCSCIPGPLSQEAVLVLIQGCLLVSRTLLTDYISRVEGHAGKAITSLVSGLTGWDMRV